MLPHAISQPDLDCDLSEQDFRLVSDIIRREAGIVVREHKQAMVRGRLARRARELGLPSLRSYCDRLKGADLAGELPGLLNALTTNHTAFFREAHHFAHLADVALPALIGQGRPSGRFRIWCAAASTGEEPYTIAATVTAWLGQRAHPDCLILATDIDSDVIATAEKGSYAESTAEKLDENQRRLLGIRRLGGGQIGVDPDFARMLRFRQLNILHQWPFQGSFQVIFCRNMLIYFDQPTKADVINRMVDVLAPGGFLYLGHSEALPGPVPGLKACGRSTYVRS
jgi:chemotaxis protein methyltransferase CheR